MDKTNRKGEVISRADVANKLKSKIRLVSNQNDGLAELRRYDNGSVGAFFKNGKFRFLSGSQKLKPRAKGSKVAYRKISPRSAIIALNKYYNNRDYKTKSARQAALTRKVCSDNKPHVEDTRFRNSPHRYEYEGVTDGARCPPGRQVHKKRQLSDRQKRALTKRLRNKSQSGGGSMKTYKDNALNRRLGRVGSPYSTARNSLKKVEADNSQEQMGGKRQISLKDAVSLLRQYYQEKYGDEQ